MSLKVLKLTPVKEFAAKGKKTTLNDF